MTVVAVNSGTPDLSLTVSSSSFVCREASAACGCASSACVWSGDILATSWPVDPQLPPELVAVFAGDEVKVNTLHTNKNFAELQQRHRWGCEVLSAQENRGRQELCSPLAHLWATCDSTPRSKAVGTPSVARHM